MLKTSFLQKWKIGRIWWRKPSPDSPAQLGQETVSTAEARSLISGWAGFTAHATDGQTLKKSNYRFPTENAGMSHSIWQALCSQFSCCKGNRLVLAWVFWLSLTCIKGSFEPVALSQCKRIVRFSSALINCTHSWHKQSIKCKLFVTALRFFHGCIVEQ